MGDSHRFDLFAKLISTNFPNRDKRIVDVAGGKGYLRAALFQLGYKNVWTQSCSKNYPKTLILFPFSFFIF